MKKYLVVLLGAVLLSGIAHTQTGDVAPYQFASVTTHSGSEIKLFKVIHQGCELFVAAGDGYLGGYATGEMATVAITTGRGCK